MTFREVFVRLTQHGRVVAQSLKIRKIFSGTKPSNTTKFEPDNARQKVEAHALRASTRVQSTTRLLQRFCGLKEGQTPSRLRQRIADIRRQSALNFNPGVVSKTALGLVGLSFGARQHDGPTERDHLDSVSEEVQQMFYPHKQTPACLDNWSEFLLGKLRSTGCISAVYDARQGMWDEGKKDSVIGLNIISRFQEDRNASEVLPSIGDNCKMLAESMVPLQSAVFSPLSEDEEDECNDDGGDDDDGDDEILPSFENLSSLSEDDSDIEMVEEALASEVDDGSFVILDESASLSDEENDFEILDENFAPCFGDGLEVSNKSSLDDGDIGSGFQLLDDDKVVSNEDVSFKFLVEVPPAPLDEFSDFVPDDSSSDEDDGFEIVSETSSIQDDDDDGFKTLWTSDRNISFKIFFQPSCVLEESTNGRPLEPEESVENLHQEASYSLNAEMQQTCANLESDKANESFHPSRDLVIKSVHYCDEEASIVQAIGKERVPARQADSFTDMEMWETGTHVRKKRSPTPDQDQESTLE